MYDGSIRTIRSVVGAALLQGPANNNNGVIITALYNGRTLKPLTTPES